MKTSEWNKIWVLLIISIINGNVLESNLSLYSKTHKKVPNLDIIIPLL